jgi:hypothetical protein
MSRNTSINLATLDFDAIKENLKQYLSSQDIFQDYDFEASNISVLLDILAHNTQHNGFYLNMIGNEMFLDSALMRDSVVSHAKELNYLPRGFRSAYANVVITIVDPAGSNSTSSSVLMPKGTSFTGKSGAKNFTFVTDNNLTVGGSAGVFTANGILIYEGDYVYDSYVVNYSDEQRYIINNKTVDTNSITVTIIEDNGATTQTYTRASTLFGHTSASKIFFVQAAENDTYEIKFGDGVIGRRPKDRSTVIIQYRDCNGELPNGIQTFTADGPIGGFANVTVTTNAKATGGAVPESLESIKFNAPRAFTTQERVVTAKDYETLLKANYSEINAVSAYGGEETNPPQYGKVFVAVDLQSSDTLPPSLKDKYKSFIKQRSPLAIDPVFVDPLYTYVRVDAGVRYNINETSLNAQDMQILVASAILNYNTINLNSFAKTLRYSKLVAQIDNAHSSIISNDTKVWATKVFVPTVGYTKNYDIDFGISFRNDIVKLPTVHDENEFHIIQSSDFILDGRICFLSDDGDGGLRIMTRSGSNHAMIKEIGSVDYDSGFIQLNSFTLDGIIGDYINIYARTEDRDITSQRNTILSMRREDINIDIEQVQL